MSGGRPPTKTLREYFKSSGRNDDKNGDGNASLVDNSFTMGITCLKGNNACFAKLTWDDDDNDDCLYLFFVEKLLQPVMGRLTN